MKRKHALAVVAAVLGLVAMRLPARADDPTRAVEPTGEELLQKLIASEQLTEIREISDLLAEYGPAEAQVQRLIDAAQATTSDARRVLLWHSIRLTRDGKGRDWLLRTIPKADDVSKCEFVRTLTNPAASDVPLLMGIYTRSKPAEQGGGRTPAAGKGADDGQREGDGNGKGDRKGEGDAKREGGGRGAGGGKGKPPEGRGDDVGDAVVRMAAGNWFDRVIDWRRRTTAIAVEADAQQRVRVRDRRHAEANEAQSLLLTWLAKNGYRDQHRVDACRAALQDQWPQWGRGMDQKSRMDLARAVAENVKTPEARAQLVYAVCPYVHQFVINGESAPVRCYLSPSQFLTAGEPVAVRLAAIDVFRERLKSRLSFVMSRDGREIYPPLKQAAGSDPAPEVRAAAEEVLSTLRDMGPN
jgi:hypothetical protein